MHGDDTNTKKVQQKWPLLETYSFINFLIKFVL